MQLGEVWGNLVLIGTVSCNLVQFDTNWCRLVQLGVDWCSLVQRGAHWCSLVQRRADWTNLMQIGATWCRLVQRGADWCKEGIWKILLRNDRAQKSHVRRSRRQVERLNSQGCFKPVVLFPFFFSRVGGWDTEPQSTQSHHSFISSYASAIPKGERVPKRTFH